jgi:hypothetical protein
MANNMTVDMTALLYVFQALLGAFGAVIWSNYNDVKKKAEKVSTDLATYQVLVAEKYTTTSEMKEALDSINRYLENFSTKLDVRLDRLELKLDRKVDKHEVPQ